MIPSLNDCQFHFWDVCIKVITTLLAVAGGLWAGYKYFQEKRERADIAIREARKDFSATRQAVYLALVRSISNIINEDPSTTNEKEQSAWFFAQRDFFKLYWGEAMLVSQDEVTTALNDFSDTLWAIIQDEEEILNSGKWPTRKGELSEKGTRVIQTCRTGLQANWNVKQQEVPSSTFATGLTLISLGKAKPNESYPTKRYDAT